MPDEPPPIPRNVLIFERLMYGCLLLSLVATPFSERLRETFARRHNAVAVAAAVVLVYGLSILAIWAIARRRRNWVRWAWFAVFTIGLVYIPGELLELRTHPIFVASSLAAYIFQAIAFWFVFTGDAVPWFRRPLDSAAPSRG